jgi:hypothetical protein
MHETLRKDETLKNGERRKMEKNAKDPKKASKG